MEYNLKLSRYSSLKLFFTCRITFLYDELDIQNEKWNEDSQHRTY